MDSRFDDLLHTIIVQKGQGIHGFFDVVLSFMYRRTDFFYEMAPGENMGFFPGNAEAIICGYFRKYQALHYKEKVPKRNIDPKEVEEFIKKQKEGGDKVEKKKEPEIKEIEDPRIAEKIKEETLKNEKIETKTEEKEIKQEVQVKKETLPETKVDKKFEAISTYNGDSCEGYNWSQGSSDVQIQINLKPETNKKMIKVDMTTTSIKVIYIQNNEEFFKADFCEKIDPSESLWSIDEKKFLNLFLVKAQELIWKSAFKGHKEIDTKTVDNSKKISEFDNDTQVALNKIIYEQNRKKNGLPTTEEEAKLKALKEAWDKPDSPFRGQPFDPKMFNLNEPIYMNTPDHEAKIKAQKEKEALNSNKN